MIRHKSFFVQSLDLFKKNIFMVFVLVESDTTIFI